MELTFPQPLKWSDDKPPAPTVTPTIGQTANAQFLYYTRPVTNQLRFYTTAGDYDPSMPARIEQYLERKPMGEQDARYLRAFGVGNEDNFNAALTDIQRKAFDRDVIERSTGLNLFLTSPDMLMSLAVPYAGVFSSTLMGKALMGSRFATNPVSMVANSRALMTGANLSAKDVARIGALDAAVTSGSLSLVDALTEISVGGDPATHIGNAMLSTMFDAALGGAVGFGLGKAFNLERPKLGTEKLGKASAAYKSYLESVTDAPANRGEDTSLTGNWFMNSWFMKAVPSALRTELSDKAIPDRFKMNILALAGDNGFPLVANQMGKSVGNSVFIDSGRRMGDWFKALDVVDNQYREVSPRGDASVLGIPVGNINEKMRKLIGKDNFTKEDWYDRIGDLYIRDVPLEEMTEYEAAAVTAVSDFFKKYETELKNVGLLTESSFFADVLDKKNNRLVEMVDVVDSIIGQNQKWMGETLDRIKTGYYRPEVLGFETVEEAVDAFARYNEMIGQARTVEDLTRLADKLDLTGPMSKALDDLGVSIRDVKDQIALLKEAIEFNKTGRAKTRYFPRLFNRRKIESDRDAFVGILMKWYRDNPSKYISEYADDGKLVVRKVDMPTDPESLMKRANETVDTILGETDDDAIDAMFNGFGRSSPLMSRRLDIPNDLISDYLIRDVKSVMIGYTSRVAPRIEFHKRFRKPDGRLSTLENTLETMRKEMRDEGIPEKTIDRHIKNFKGLYDLVVGAARKRPDALDTRAADYLRSLTTWSFLNSSGIAALGDVASLFMDHELNVIGRGFLGLLDGIDLGLGKRELNLAGEALEFTMGATHARYLESMSSNPFMQTMPDRINNFYFAANGLGSVTLAVKSMDGLLRSHTILEASEKFLAGKASKFEKQFLAQYNITEDMMKRFAKMPTEQSKGGLRLANTEAWSDDEAVIAFRNALRSGTANRVIMASPADKPFVMSGFTYIPDNVASILPFDLPVDPAVKGYRRIESGLLSLPFTFYSYTFGALSKITANHASGAVRNRLTHIAVAMGLGYLIVKTRTPSWAWDQMDTEDKIARAFDFSGLAALYSDLAYRGIAMAHEMGVESSFPIQPKFSGEVDPLGAMVSLGGAPADWSYSVMSAIGDMTTGNMSDGAKGLVRVFPLINVLAFQGVLKEAAMDIASELPNRQ